MVSSPAAHISEEDRPLQACLVTKAHCRVPLTGGGVRAEQRVQRTHRYSGERCNRNGKDKNDFKRRRLVNIHGPFPTPVEDQEAENPIK